MFRFKWSLLPVLSIFFGLPYYVSSFPTKLWSQFVYHVRSRHLHEIGYPRS